jgi:hypothetical protein
MPLHLFLFVVVWFFKKNKRSKVQSLKTSLKPSLFLSISQTSFSFFFLSARDANHDAGLVSLSAAHLPFSSPLFSFF